jgi:hypothetical protein
MCQTCHRRPRTRPASVSSIQTLLGCDRDQWFERDESYSTGPSLQRAELTDLKTMDEHK